MWWWGGLITRLNLKAEIAGFPKYFTSWGVPSQCTMSRLAKMRLGSSCASFGLGSDSETASIFLSWSLISSSLVSTSSTISSLAISILPFFYVVFSSLQLSVHSTDSATTVCVCAEYRSDNPDTLFPTKMDFSPDLVIENKFEKKFPELLKGEQCNRKLFWCQLQKQEKLYEASFKSENI